MHSRVTSRVAETAEMGDAESSIGILKRERENFLKRDDALWTEGKGDQPSTSTHKPAVVGPPPELRGIMVLPLKSARCAALM